MSRKPISVVKNVLSRNCSGLTPPPDIYINDTNRESWCDWAPFGNKIFAGHCPPCKNKSSLNRFLKKAMFPQNSPHAHVLCML